MFNYNSDSINSEDFLLDPHSILSGSDLHSYAILRAELLLMLAMFRACLIIITIIMSSLGSTVGPRPPKFFAIPILLNLLKSIKNYQKISSMKTRKNSVFIYSTMLKSASEKYNLAVVSVFTLVIKVPITRLYQVSPMSPPEIGVQGQNAPSSYLNRKSHKACAKTRRISASGGHGNACRMRAKCRL